MLWHVIIMSATDDDESCIFNSDPCYGCSGELDGTGTIVDNYLIISDIWLNPAQQNPSSIICFNDNRILSFTTPPSVAYFDNIFSYDDYIYLWEMAPSSEGPWEEADGTNNQETYSTTTNTVVVETTTWYRCVVTSVDCGDVDITDPIDLTFLTELDAGSLDEFSYDEDGLKYCPGSNISITFADGQSPSGANGENDYNYQWQVSETENGSYVDVSEYFDDDSINDSNIVLNLLNQQTGTLFYQCNVSSDLFRVYPL